MIIGIAGKKQSGKDTVAAMIQYIASNSNMKLDDWLVLNYKLRNTYSHWIIRRYADKLKEMVCLLTGCTRADLEKEEFKNKVLDDCWQRELDFGTYDWLNGRSKITYKDALQYIGTDLFRNMFHADTWVNATMADYDKYILKGTISGGKTVDLGTLRPVPNWIIPDVRFPNEIKAIKNRDGIIIRLQRPDNDNGDNHLSETALDEYDGYDYVINNNADFLALYNRVVTVLQLSNVI